MTDAQRKRYKRNKRRKHGVCTECGGILEDTSKKLCARCREMTAASSRRFRQKKKG